MTKAKSHLPDGIRTITPMLTLKNSREAIEWYKKALGAEARTVVEGPTAGSTIHAEIRIGDSSIFMADETPMSHTKSVAALGAATASLTIYVPDCDAVYDQAVKAGAQVVMPMADMFWGDRYSTIRDPFGCLWSIATHKEDLTSEEMDQRMRAFMANMSKQAP